jgi:hypothetical protein
VSLCTFFEAILRRDKVVLALHLSAHFFPRLICHSIRSTSRCSALLNARNRDAHARERQRAFGGEGGVAELLWFSGSARSDNDALNPVEAAVEVVAELSPASPAPAPSAADMRDENDRTGAFVCCASPFLAPFAVFSANAAQRTALHHHRCALTPLQFSLPSARA